MSDLRAELDRLEALHGEVKPERYGTLDDRGYDGLHYGREYVAGVYRFDRFNTDEDFEAWAKRAAQLVEGTLTALPAIVAELRRLWAAESQTVMSAPTEPGYYWARKGNDEWEVVRVYLGFRDRLWAMLMGDESHVSADDFHFHFDQWRGPLALPGKGY